MQQIKLFQLDCLMGGSADLKEDFENGINRWLASQDHIEPGSVQTSVEVTTYFPPSGEGGNSTFLRELTTITLTYNIGAVVDITQRKKELGLIAEEAATPHYTPSN